jgi:hypothetical protein
MEEIKLNKEEFKLFDQYDQIGFFYDDNGFPMVDADITFNSDVDGLYQQYDYIIVDDQDNIYGLKGDDRELMMENVIEAYDIAREVKEYQ